MSQGNGWRRRAPLLYGGLASLVDHLTLVGAPALGAEIGLDEHAALGLYSGYAVSVFFGLVLVPLLAVRIAPRVLTPVLAGISAMALVACTVGGFSVRQAAMLVLGLTGLPQAALLSAVVEARTRGLGATDAETRDELRRYLRNCLFVYAITAGIARAALLHVPDAPFLALAVAMGLASFVLPIVLRHDRPQAKPARLRTLRVPAVWVGFLLQMAVGAQVLLFDGTSQHVLRTVALPEWLSALPRELSVAVPQVTWIVGLSIVAGLSSRFERYVHSRLLAWAAAVLLAWSLIVLITTADLPAGAWYGLYLLAQMLLALGAAGFNVDAAASMMAAAQRGLAVVAVGVTLLGKHAGGGLGRLLLGREWEGLQSLGTVALRAIGIGLLAMGAVVALAWTARLHRRNE